MAHAGLYLCSALFLLLVRRRQLGLWVLWCMAFVVVLKAVPVSTDDGLGQYMLLSFYFPSGCFCIVLLTVSQQFINII